jgi:hypothetical protein
MKKGLLGIFAIVLFVMPASADINVPAGFVVDKLIGHLDGETPRLEAIRNSEYGYGVIAASMDKNVGILRIYKISVSNFDLLGSLSGFPVPNYIETVQDIGFDQTGLFSHELYVTVWVDTDTHHSYTDFIHVGPSGDVSKLWSEGGANNELAFSFAFSDGNNGYSPGAYLEDMDSADGTSFWHMDIQFNRTRLSQNLVPPGRTDMDIRRMAFDPTGLYSGKLTMVDSDDTDNWAVIYQLDPNLSWHELTAKVRRSVRSYEDMSFSSGGSFGRKLYVTDTVSKSVMSVDPNGLHTVFASGFSGIESVSISDDGENMFVSDVNGVYMIRPGTNISGPQIVMQEPKVEPDGVHTNPSGIDSVKLLWSDQILFDNGDINIVNEDGNNVTFSVLGSNSQFMIIAFGKTLLDDNYTITIHDTVKSAVTGAAIDGDKNGLAGGNAILVMEHRERQDSDNDNDIDMIDLAQLAEKWLWGK